MKKKIVTLCLVIALVATMVAGGTLAYFTDTDEAVNVMTLGNVKIEQLEYERVVDVNGKWVPASTADKYNYTPDMLQPFTQDKPLFPAVFADGVIKWDDREVAANAAIAGKHHQSWGQVGASGAMQLFDDSVKNVIDKFVFVKNTGASDAYVRTWVALELGSVAADDFESVIETKINKTNWIWNDMGTAVIGDTTYVIWCATYQGADGKGILAPGTVSYPSLTQVYMLPKATNEDAAAIDGNGNGKYEILVFSQAVQTAGFATPADALNEAFGTAHPWTATYVVDTPAEVNDGLAAGGNTVLTDDVQVPKAEAVSNGYGATGISQTNGGTLDGNGNEVGVNAWSTWDCAINTTGGTIKNVKVTSGMRGIFINHNSTTNNSHVYLEDVIIDGTVYTISCDQGTNQGLTATNSVFNGWTSYAATIGDVKFIDCSFGEGQGYAFCRPYAPTEFVGCDFAAGYEIDARAAVTFENCTIGGVALTDANLATLVTGGIANATVK